MKARDKRKRRKARLARWPQYLRCVRKKSADMAVVLRDLKATLSCESPIVFTREQAATFRAEIIEPTPQVDGVGVVTLTSKHKAE
jgi:hypothetical protein